MRDQLSQRWQKCMAESASHIMIELEGEYGFGTMDQGMTFKGSSLVTCNLSHKPQFQKSPQTIKLFPTDGKMDLFCCIGNHGPKALPIPEPSTEGSNITGQGMWSIQC